MKQFVVILLFVSVLSGCSSLPENLREPVNDKLSIIGVYINHKNKIFPDENSNKVFFVKIKKLNDIYDSINIIESNYSKGKYAFLINAEPGKYVAVAARFVSQTEAISYFNEDLIKATLIDVKDGEIAFMGKFDVDDIAPGVWSTELPQDIQQHYRQQLCWNETIRVVMSGFANKEIYDGQLKKSYHDEKTSDEFLQVARNVFGSTVWANALNKFKL